MKKYIFNTVKYKVSRKYRDIKSSYWFLQKKGLKQWILAGIFKTFENIDDKHAEEYETAPYCGHHYSGINGKYVKTDYWEGMGGGSLNFSLFGYTIFYCTEEGYSIEKRK